MTAATLYDVSKWTERDSFFLYFAGAFKSALRDMALWLFLPFCLVGVVILAQLYPYRMHSAIKSLNEALPHVKDREDLEFFRDMLRIAYGVGQFYQHFCFFRAKIREALSEVDETIDSLNFVLAFGQELNEFVAVSEARRTPQLPLVG